MVNNQKYSNLIIVILIISWLECLVGLEHIVGDSVWSIPENTDFYYNWSINQSFHLGDTLVFEFQSEFHNVMQVSKREYDACSAENPFQEFTVGPANIPLIQEGVYYFICSFANYCSLGQKLSITVHGTRSSPPLPMSPPPVYYSQPPLHDNVAVPSPVGSITSVSLMSQRINSPSICSSACSVSGLSSILSVALYFGVMF